MKTKIKFYWVIIALVVFANITIFMYFSRRLENFMVESTLEAQARNEL